MSTVQRQVVVSLCFSLLIFALSMVIAFVAFPLPNWSALWKTKIMDLPFIIISPTISLIIGLVFGIVSGLSMRKQLNSISDTLFQIEQGRSIEEPLENQSTEFEMIWDRLKRVQKHIADQVKSSQKLANEKAIDQEKRIQEIVSEERNRLARELHDSVSQQLFAASMMMSAINETRPITDDYGTKQLKMVEEMIHQSQLEMRALLLHLRPVALKGKSLQEGIKELLLELTQKVPVEIESKIETFHIEKGVEDHLFRILQESVSNTLRHSKANHLEVLLIERDEFIILRIVDDGIGFNVDETKAGSYGLHNMQERAIEIGGTMRIISMKNKGTRIEVKIPMMK
ncbi:sensor histidine kinase [Ferdinandcohnia quinoae]|uniref:Sensor histidine kinase n=1 Tax=Fredinandcohnia quinoae TaxID=2918902 RepID=A0AAW5DUG5_9BACI|nr:sensor histidine kinase [Fredinandcohnia sp. SECRCQ15]MCH1624271.1 sensor histidine kinase [Fredinandcohnia sp. SECRCQ15]